MYQRAVFFNGHFGAFYVNFIGSLTFCSPQTNVKTSLFSQKSKLNKRRSFSAQTLLIIRTKIPWNEPREKSTTDPLTPWRAPLQHRSRLPWMCDLSLHRLTSHLRPPPALLRLPAAACGWPATSPLSKHVFPSHRCYCCVCVCVTGERANEREGVCMSKRVPCLNEDVTERSFWRLILKLIFLNQSCSQLISNSDVLHFSLTVFT